MISGRFTLFAAVALSCAALANADCLVEPTNGVVTADQITDRLTVLGLPTTHLPENAFKFCTNLATVTLPDGLTTMGGDTFYGCTNLATVTLPDGLTSMGDYMGYGTFSGCTNLATVTLPDSLITMGFGTFSGCTNLATVTLPDSLTTMGSHTFYGCTNLATVTLPDSLITMGDSTFHGCTSLTTACGGTGLTSTPLPNTWTWAASIGTDIGGQAASDLTAALTAACPTTSSVVANEEADACSAKCCKGAWSGTTCTTAEDGLILVKHDTTSGHSHHRCYEDASHATRGCRCQCADSAGDFTADNKMFSS